jgi:ribosome-associated protein
MAEPEDGLFVRPGLTIPEAELSHTALRAGGPGGQNVNKVSSGILLRFDLEGSATLTTSQKERVRSKLGARLTKTGELLVKAVEHREQGRNLAAARERLAALLAEALHVLPPRRATRPTRGSVRRRITDKRQRSERKRERGGGWD